MKICKKVDIEAFEKAGHHCALKNRISLKIALTHILSIKLRSIFAEILLIEDDNLSANALDWFN